MPSTEEVPLNTSCIYMSLHENLQMTCLDWSQDRMFSSSPCLVSKVGMQIRVSSKTKIAKHETWALLWDWSKHYTWLEEIASLLCLSIWKLEDEIFKLAEWAPCWSLVSGLSWNAESELRRLCPALAKARAWACISCKLTSSERQSVFEQWSCPWLKDTWPASWMGKPSWKSLELDRPDLSGIAGLEFENDIQDRIFWPNVSCVASVLLPELSCEVLVHDILSSKFWGLGSLSVLVCVLERIPSFVFIHVHPDWEDLVLLSICLILWGEWLLLAEFSSSSRLCASFTFAL